MKTVAAPDRAGGERPAMLRKVRFRPVAALMASLVLAIGCHRRPDFDAYRAEVLALHRSFIDAHLAKDASFLAAPLAEDYLFVSGGEVLRMAPDEVERDLAEYLNATTFSEYRDLSDPIIGFSQDGSVAWSIVKVRVAGTQTVGEDVDEPFDTQWAWITLYERRDEKWIRIADVSTSKEFEETP